MSEKLTKAQTHLLSRLSAGEVLTVSTGRYYRASFHSGDQNGVNPRTISALRRLGFVESRHHGHPLSVGTSQVLITDAGRAALEKTP